MKKFSKISNFKANLEKPEAINDGVQSVNLKYSIHKLIEEFLNIRIEGPIDPILEGTILIDGQEEFICAMIEFFRQDDVKEQIKLLENVRFNGLDNTLDSLNAKLNEAQIPSERAKHTKRIKDLVERSKGDLSKIKIETNRQADKIQNGEKAYYRSLAAENLIGEEGMNKKTLKEISKIFLFRSQQLGYRK